LWIIAAACAVVWAWSRAVSGGAILNPAGLPQLGDVAAAALQPDLSGGFLAVLLRATATTLAFALLGTALALLFGVPFGVVVSHRWWSGAAGHTGTGARRWWFALRVTSAIPRGLHEAVLAVILVQVLGRDPMVAIIAIAVPFGAITAKVVADIIDTTDPHAFDALRHAGSGRLPAFMYGIAPTVARPIADYGVYRFECAIRSAAVLGVIGVGGLGFELALSFQSLRFEQVWTIVYVLAALAVAVDRGSRYLLSNRTTPVHVHLLGLLAAATVAAWWLSVDPRTLWAPRARQLAGEFVDAAWPPTLPTGGWGVLIEAVTETVAMSLVALVVAVCIFVPGATIAAHRQRHRVGRAVAATVRAIAVVARSVPPPVWALIVLFVIRPGPLAAGLALGIGAGAVLTRLGADALDTTDPGPRDALRAAGASSLTAGAYGSLPIVVPRYVGLSTYRWEVAMRDTVVVGLVGAGGLGRLLAEQQVAFDESAMLATIMALLVLALGADLIGVGMRRAFG
jgi:phosphonate transport system permease protein